MGGLRELEDLQYCEYYEIYKLASDILEKVYQYEQVDEIEKMKMFNSLDQDFMIWGEELQIKLWINDFYKYDRY